MICLFGMGQANADQYDIVINEIMYNPSNDDNDGGEYLELYNKGTTSVDLSGWTIGGIGDFSIPAGTTLASGNYLITLRSGNFVTARQVTLIK